MRDSVSETKGQTLALIALLGIILVTAALTVGFRPWSGQSAAGVSLGMVDGGDAPEPGDPAPDFVLQRADGSVLRLSDLKGRPIVLNFWADWCTTCADEMRGLQQLAEMYGDGLAVLAVNAGDPVEVGERIVDEVGISYERAYDLDLAVTDGYRVLAMPSSFFIDGEGIVVDRHPGAMSYETMLEMAAAVAGDPGR